MRSRCHHALAAGLLLSALILAGLSGSRFASGATAPRRSGSGLAGRVIAGPTCPVESVPPRPACAPRPIEATLAVRRRAPHAKTRFVHSGGDGRFRVALSPGVYWVRALRLHHRAFPRPPGPLRVRILADRWATITVRYDTGIR